jgi:hypothetical protein
MRRSAWMCWGALLFAVPPLAHAASIDLVAADQTCHLALSDAQRLGTFSVVAVGGATATYCAGLAGAGFRIAGLTGDWLVAWEANPQANGAIGNPFGSGVEIAFGSASMAPSVELYSMWVEYLPPGDPPPLTLSVGAPDPLFSTCFPCPMVIGGDCLYDDPIACAAGGLYVNSDGDCLSGLAADWWAAVKRLYQE